jgi:hypothetical protein
LRKKLGTLLKNPSLKDNKNKWKFQKFVILVNLFATLGGMALKWAHCWTPWVNQHPQRHDNVKSWT